MSFDLGVWHEPALLTADEAAAKYKALCEGADFPAHESVAAFRDDVTAQYPDLTADLNSPWSAALGVTGAAVVMAIQWASSLEVVGVIRDLAERHDLVCYDPQAGIVHNRPSLRQPVQAVLTACLGPRIEDPEPGHLDRALRRLSPHNWFTMLERANGHYMQVAIGRQAGVPEGHYALECREGGPEHHSRRVVADIDEALSAFQSFAVATSDWREAPGWEKYEIESPPIP